MIHELKLRNDFFADVASGKKTFELRENDRGFQVGDLLALNEVENTEKGVEYTGRSMLVYVDYILPSAWDALKSGYVIMSIKPCHVAYAANPLSSVKMGADYSVRIMERGEWER